MSIAKNAFFELLRAGLWGDGNPDIRIDGTTDWQEVYQLAQEQSVQGLVLSGIEELRAKNLELSIPRVPLLQWIGEVQVIEQRNKEMNAFIADLIEKLRKADIYAILVKGQGIAQCYEKPLWRCSGDVDLFLCDDNYEKAKALLVPMATNMEPEWAFKKHLGLSIDEWLVELHGSLRGGLSSGIDKVLDNINRQTFLKGNVRSFMMGRTQVFMLGIENDIAYVFAHILDHFYKGGIGLRQICDWSRLLYTYREKLNREALELRIKQMGVMTEWRAFYNLASRYLGMPDLDSRFMARDSRFDKKADGIMAFVLEVGNFGQNRDTSYYNTKPFVVRKAISFCHRCSDFARHARIFPLGSLKFFPYMVFNGMRETVRGE